MPFPVNDSDVARIWGTRTDASAFDDRSAGWGSLLDASVDRFQSGLYGVAEAAGVDSAARPRMENQVEAELGRRQAERNLGVPGSYRDVDGAGSAARYVGGLLANSAPELALSAATGGVSSLAGLGLAGRAALGASVMYPSALGDVLSNQREESGRTNFGAAGALAVPYAAADLLGVEGALMGRGLPRMAVKALDDGTGWRHLAGRAAVNTGVTALAEGGQETFQEGMNQLGRMSVNPEQTLFNSEANDRYLESFVGGAAMGGGVALPFSGRRSEAWHREQVEREQARQRALDIERGKPADLLAPPPPQVLAPGEQGALDLTGGETAPASSPLFDNGSGLLGGPVPVTAAMRDAGVDTEALAAQRQLLTAEKHNLLEQLSALEARGDQRMFYRALESAYPRIDALDQQLAAIDAHLARYGDQGVQGVQPGLDFSEPGPAPALPARLGYSPLAGVPTVFPDGTVTLNGEQELQARYPNNAGRPADPPTPSPLEQHQAQVRANVEAYNGLKEEAAGYGIKGEQRVGLYAQLKQSFDMLGPEEYDRQVNNLAVGAVGKVKKALEQINAVPQDTPAASPAPAATRAASSTPGQTAPTQPAVAPVAPVPPTARPDAVAPVAQPAQSAVVADQGAGGSQPKQVVPIGPQGGKKNVGMVEHPFLDKTIRVKKLHWDRIAALLGMDDSGRIDPNDAVTQSELARRTGVGRSAINETLRLFNLTDADITRILASGSPWVGASDAVETTKEVTSKNEKTGEVEKSEVLVADNAKERPLSHDDADLGASQKLNVWEGVDGENDNGGGAGYAVHGSLADAARDHGAGDNRYSRVDDYSRGERYTSDEDRAAQVTADALVAASDGKITPRAAIKAQAFGADLTELNQIAAGAEARAAAEEAETARKDAEQRARNEARAEAEAKQRVKSVPKVAYKYVGDLYNSLRSEGNTDSPEFSKLDYTHQYRFMLGLQELEQEGTRNAETESSLQHEIERSWYARDASARAGGSEQVKAGGGNDPMGSSGNSKSGGDGAPSTSQGLPASVPATPQVQGAGQTGESGQVKRSVAAAPEAAFTVAQVREVIGKQYAKILKGLEVRGLVTIAQTVEQAREAAARARAAKTGDDITTARASMERPADALDLKYSTDGYLQGFYDPVTRKSFLVADGLRPQTAVAVLMHEVGIHMASDGSLDGLFNRASMILRNNPGNSFVERVRKRMEHAGETSGEEAAAYIVEEYLTSMEHVPASIKNWIDSLYAAIRAWMFRKGVIITADHLSVADMVAVAKANAKSLSQGELSGGTSPQAQELRGEIDRYERLLACLTR